MKPKVLLIRPELESLETTEILKARGYDVVISPLLEITPLKDVKIDPADAYILTSQNAARFLDKIPQETPLYVIGEKTAESSRKRGFQEIHTAEGGASSLVALIEKQAPKSRKLVHLSGNVLAVDVARILTEKGYQASRNMLYKTTYIEKLDSQSMEALQQKQISAVLLYSPKSANAFQKAVAKESLSFVHGICLSEAILQEVETLDWKTLSVSAKKTTQSMIDQLDQILFKCHNDLNKKSGS